ncbi:DHHC zinc finger domain containing protein [Tritrichomonas foetus]|uniref:Palmitoyltransferase n=1 Tax=Tritrichomonas foetus TaxID=1144522 RepID=A0A1J4K2D9_9EUKA|nr:DHHC zinc finger domain containing protein [Tritrichomonas foetus]|eukprot:OHT05363.1 DHHC zinc finger domain containing protein [Tritrichomonas foetus]
MIEILFQSPKSNVSEMNFLTINRSLCNSISAIFSNIKIMEDFNTTPLLFSSNFYQDEKARIRSNYKTICCKQCHIAYFRIPKFVFCGHWMVQLFPTLLLCIFHCSTLIIWYFDIIQCRHEVKNLYYLYGIVLFTFLCSCISYILIICYGPGYLPYNWAETHEMNLSWEREMSLIAIYKEQVEFARFNSRPPRSSFSIKARRFVLRADHYCIWVTSWIGLKNQRYFLLMTFYVPLYHLLTLVFRYHWWNLVLKKWRFIYILSFTVMLLQLFIIIFSLIQFIKGLKNTIQNRTLIERWSSNHWYKIPQKNCISNFEEICGSKKLFLFWFFPCFCLSQNVDGLYKNYRDKNDKNNENDENGNNFTINPLMDNLMAENS